MTGAAFQAKANLKEQVTDPISHTPVKKRLPDQGVPRHLRNSMVDTGIQPLREKGQEYAQGFFQS